MPGSATSSVDSRFHHPKKAYQGSDTCFLHTKLPPLTILHAHFSLELTIDCLLRRLYYVVRTMLNEAIQMEKIEREMMRGLGPTAVLQILSDEEMYGYELVKTVGQRSNGVFKMGQSTLYPMLYNLESKGLIASKEKQSPNGRTRRYYRLTAKGKKKLAADKQLWANLVDAMGSLGLSRTIDLNGGLA